MPRRTHHDKSKFLPVLFVWAVIVVQYICYMLYYCLPLLQLRKLPQYRDHESVRAGIIIILAFHALLFMVIYCYVMTILTDPGSVPDDGWDVNTISTKEDLALAQPDPHVSAETKRSGGRRQCKWCLKYKPDRAHHCRMCKRCVLVMDHHCPWVYNCIGHHNHKYFFLLLFYVVILVNIMAITVVGPIRDATSHGTGDTVGMLMVTMIMSCSVAFVTTSFFTFHIYLTATQMTTLEFCEQRSRGTQKNYSEGLYRNICRALGSNPLLWLIPTKPEGEGLHFVVRGGSESGSVC